MWRSSSFWPSKGWSIPAFQGRHLVIRNYDYLYCFAAPQ